MSRNEAFALPEKWGGRDCLLPVDIKMVQKLKEMLGGEALLQFTTDEFSTFAQAAYDELGIQHLTRLNIWDVFVAMLPLVFA